MSLSGTGYSPADMAQCNSYLGQPVLVLLGPYVPVSCSQLTLTTIPGSGPNKGDLSGTHTFEMGTVGPPLMASYRSVPRGRHRHPQLHDDGKRRDRRDLLPLSSHARPGCGWYHVRPYGEGPGRGPGCWCLSLWRGGIVTSIAEVTTRRVSGARPQPPLGGRLSFSMHRSPGNHSAREKSLPE
jgi:hypothetical protein